MRFDDLWFLVELVGEPVERLEEIAAIDCRRRKDVPLAKLQRAEVEGLGNLFDRHRSRQILLVRQHEQHGIFQLVFDQHARQFVAHLFQSIAIVAVDDEYDRLRVLEIVSPKRSDFASTADVPYREVDVVTEFVLRFNRLNIETNCWNLFYKIIGFVIVRLFRGFVVLFSIKNNVPSLQLRRVSFCRE